jgi:O-antigen/teichoic acid export membrane protein
MAVFAHTPAPREPSRAAAGDHDSGSSALSHLTSYSAARYASELFFLARGLLLARILGPAVFGLWSQMKIAMLFLNHSHLGVHEAMLREVPFARGRGDALRAERIKGVVFGFNLLTTTLVAAAILAASFVLLDEGSPGTRWSWFLFVGFYVAAQLYWYSVLRLRSEKRIGQASRTMAGFALLSTVGGVLAAYHFGLPGFLLACIPAYLVAASLGRGAASFPRPRWDAAELRTLLGIGSPIMAAGALLLLLWNVDKLAVWALLSRESLGIYALGSYLVAPVMLVPEAVSVVLYPRLVARFARDRREDEVRRYLTTPTLLLAYLASPALVALFLALPLPFAWWLPGYAAAVAPARVLVAALFVMVLARMPNIMLVSLNRQRTLLLITATSSAISAAAVVTLIRGGAGLIGAALGAATGFLVYSAWTMTAALRTLRVPAREAVSFLSMTLLPYVVTAAGVGLVLLLVPERSAPPATELARTVLRCLLALLPPLLLFWAMRRRLGLPRAGASRTG